MAPGGSPHSERAAMPLGGCGPRAPASATVAEPEALTTQAGSAFSFLALIKTLRLLRLRRMLNSLRKGSGSELVSLGVIVFVWLLITHWCGCAFFAFGWMLCGEGARTWVTEYFDGTDRQGLPVLTDTCGEGTPDDIGRIHLRAMYWALSTMSSLGYGSAPVAVTDAEFILAMAVQVLGACSLALVFSNIAKIMARLDAVQARYTAHLDSINEFGKFYKLPKTMRHRLTEYVTFSFGVSRGISIQEVTASLPQTIRGEVLYLMHEQLLRKVPMFRKTDDMFIKALVRTLQPQVLLRGDYLFRMNEPGDSMFFIKNGCVQIKNLDGTVVFASLMPGAFLGELSMLTGQRRTASAQAIVDCVLFLIRSTDFDEVMKDFPSYLGSILEGAMERLEKTLESNASIENTKLVQQTRRRLRSHQVLTGTCNQHMSAAEAGGVLHPTCQPALGKSEDGAPQSRRRLPRRLTREAIADVMNSVTEGVRRRAPKEGCTAGTDERRCLPSSERAPVIKFSSSIRSNQVEPEPTATSELTPPPEPARKRRPSRDLFLEQAAVDAEGREQAAASGYSDMRYSDAARKTAGTLLDDDQARLRQRRHTTGDVPTSPPTKLRGLDEDASFQPDAQPEIQSEILDSIRGLKSEMHELRALMSEMHLRK